MFPQGVGGGGAPPSGGSGDEAVPASGQMDHDSLAGLQPPLENVIPRSVDILLEELEDYQSRSKQNRTIRGKARQDMLEKLCAEESLMTAGIATVVIRNLAEQLRVPGLAVDVFQRLRTLGFQPDGPTYIQAISACGKCRQAQLAMELFREVKADQGNTIVLDVVFYNVLLSVCEKGDRLEAVYEILADMAATNVQPNAYTYTALISALGKFGETRKAITLLDEMKANDVPPTIWTYTALISTCGKNKRLDDAFDVFQEMKGAGIAPTVVTYNALISACAKAGNALLATAIFREMKNQRVAPTVITYSAMISACGRGGKLDEAFGIFSEMKNSGYRPSVETYSALISACEKSSRADIAIKLFEKMKADRIRPNVITYSTMISACGKGKRLDEAFEVFEEMKRAGLEPNAITFNSLIAACHNSSRADNHVADRALAVFRDMKAAGVPADVITYNALISACEKARNLTGALQIFDALKASGLKPNVRTYSALIAACDQYRGRLGGQGADQRASLAQTLFQEMKDAKVVPNALTYRALISSLGKGRRPADALAAFHDMKRAGVPADVYVYTAAISACDSANVALTLFEGMEGDGVVPNMVTYSALVSACGRAGRLDDALIVFEDMKRSSKLKPTVWVYNALMTACAGGSGTSAGDNAKQAVAIFEEMKAGMPALAPNLKTYTCLISACATAGESDGDASEWLGRALDSFEEMKSVGVEPDAQLYDIMLSVCELYTGTDTHKVAAVMAEINDVVAVEKSEHKPPSLMEEGAGAGAGGKQRSRKMWHKTIKKWGYDDSVSGTSHARLKQAFKAFQKMKGTPTPPNLRTYHELFSVCNTLGGGEKALQLLRELQADSSVEPNEVTYNWVLKVCGSSDDLQNALAVQKKIFNEMLETPGVILNCDTFNAMLRTYRRQTGHLHHHHHALYSDKASQKRAEDAGALFLDMKARDLVPDITTYNTLIHIFGQVTRNLGASGLDCALAVFEEMKAADCKPDILTCVRVLSSSSSSSPPPPICLFRSPPPFALYSHLSSFLPPPRGGCRSIKHKKGGGVLCQSRM
jgi:pentatricopeptide repeat domain-containing protein 1